MEFLGLTTDQEKIYFTLLSLGQSSPGELAKHVNMTPEKITQVLKELEAKQYVMPVKGIGNRHVAIYPFKLLAEKTFGSAKELREAINQLNDKINEHLTRISTTSQEQQARITSIITQTIEEKDNMLSESKERIEQVVSERKSILETKKNELELHVQQFKDGSQESLQQARNQLQQTIEQVNTLKDQKIQEVRAIMDTETRAAIDQFKESVPRTLNDTLQQVDETMNTTSAQVQEAGNKMKEFANELSTMTLKLIEDQLASIVEETETQLSMAGNTLESQVTQFSGLMTGKSQNLLRMLADALSTFKQNASNTANRISNDWITIIKQKNQGFQQNVNAQLTDLEKNLQAKFNELRVQLTKFTADLEQMIVDQVKLVTQQALEQANQMEADFTEGITKGKDALVDNVNATVDSSTENVNTIVTSFQSDWTQSLEQWKNVLGSVKQNVIKKAKDQLDARKIVAKNDISAFQTRTTSELNEIIQNIMSKTSELKEKTTQLRQQSLSQFESMMQSFQQAMEQVSTKASENIDSSIQLGIEQMVNGNQQLVETLETRLNELISTSLTPILTTQNEATTVIEETKAVLQEFQQKLATNAQQALEQLSSSLQSSLGTQLEELSQQLKEFTSYFENGTNQITSVLNAMFQSLTDLESKFQAFEKPQVSTIPLMGKEAIMDHIISMMDRVPFSRMTILAPNVRDLPIEKIANHKKARFIRLYTYANLNADREPLQQLLKAGVQIFRIPETDEKWKGNIVTEAGDSEAVWAVYDPINPLDAMGLASSSDAFISVVVGLVLQSLLTYREQVREQDVGL